MSDKQKIFEHTALTNPGFLCLSSCKQEAKAFIHLSTSEGFELYSKLAHQGDSILGTFITLALFEYQPNADLSVIDALRADITSDTQLSHFAQLLLETNQCPVVCIPEDEKKEEWAAKEHTYAFKAYIATLYMERGFEVVLRWIKQLILPCIQHYLDLSKTTKQLEDTDDMNRDDIGEKASATSEEADIIMASAEADAKKNLKRKRGSDEPSNTSDSDDDQDETTNAGNQSSTNSADTHTSEEPVVHQQTSLSISSKGTSPAQKLPTDREVKKYLTIHSKQHELPLKYVWKDLGPHDEERRWECTLKLGDELQVVAKTRKKSLAKTKAAHTMFKKVT